MTPDPEHNAVAADHMEFLRGIDSPTIANAI